MAKTKKKRRPTQREKEEQRRAELRDLLLAYWRLAPHRKLADLIRNSLGWSNDDRLRKKLAFALAEADNDQEPEIREKREEQMERLVKLLDAHALHVGRSLADCLFGNIEPLGHGPDDALERKLLDRVPDSIAAQVLEE